MKAAHTSRRYRKKLPNRFFRGYLVVSKALYGSNRKKLKNSIDCDGVENIVDALPEEITELIINKLDVEDLHCFGAACRSWRSIAIAAKKTRRLHLRPQLPWLMLSSIKDHLQFFSLSHGKVFRLEMPQVEYGASCYGSNWGWLIMVGKGGRNFLFNPFTQVVIELPRQATLPILAWGDNHINKAMLLSPPTAATTNNSNLDDDKNIVSSGAKDDCVVIAVHSFNELAFCRPGDKAWTALGEKGFRDIILYDGKLHAISDKCDLQLVELGTCPKLISCNIPPPVEDYFSLSTKLRNYIYLVECLGELLMVIKYYPRRDYGCYTPSMLKVFKLDSKGRSWTKVEDLGDQMLFIGKSTALSVSARDYPGFRGNCIYFTTIEGFVSVEATISGTLATVFHLEDNRFEPFFSNEDSDCALYPPIWFTPISG